MSEDLALRIVRLGNSVVLMRKQYAKGRTKLAERMALAAHEQIGEIRSRLLDQIQAEWQRTKWKADNEPETGA